MRHSRRQNFDRSLPDSVLIVPQRLRPSRGIRKSNITWCGAFLVCYLVQVSLPNVALNLLQKPIHETINSLKFSRVSGGDRSNAPSLDNSDTLDLQKESRVERDDT